jgi:HK97 family phage prohead protease
MTFVRPTGQEQRTISAELRTSAGDEFALVGRAAAYNSWSRDLGGFREILKPGTFSRSVRNGDDVKALFNHDPSRILGRTKSGTLTLQDTENGLRFRVQLDKNSQQHRDLYCLVQRGDLDSCSFAFVVPPGGQQWSEGPDPEDASKRIALRTITDVDLKDVSIVTEPAYEATSVSARSKPTDYGTLDKVKANLRILKRAARAMAQDKINALKCDLRQYPEPYDYKALEAHYSIISDMTECASALSETVDDILASWPEDEENSRAKRCSSKAFRAAHGLSHASLRAAAEHLIYTREHLRRLTAAKIKD